MAESAASILIGASRARVYRALADIQTLARCLQPEGTSARIISYDAGGILRTEITHGPAPEDTRRFRLSLLELRPEQALTYAAAFETADPLLAGEMKLHFLLDQARDATRLTVRHEGIPPGIRVEDNQRGTESSLKNIARLVESGGADAL